MFGVTKFVAADANATKRPVELKTGSKLDPFGVAPFAPIEIVWETPAGLGFMTKLTVFEWSTGKPGFNTETCTVAGEAISAADTCIVNCVGLTNVDGGGVLVLLGFAQKPIASALKLLPFTVSVNAGPPAVALVGEMEEMDGVRVDGLDVIPPPPQDDNPTILEKNTEQNKR